MSLTNWLDNRWIVRHDPDPAEIAALFGVVTRDLDDAAVPRLSADRRLGIAYNAALQLATLALAAEGYRAGRDRAHERAIQSLRYTAGLPQEQIDVIDAVRRKRNLINYEHAGTTSDAEASSTRRSSRSGPQSRTGCERHTRRWRRTETGPQVPQIHAKGRRFGPLSTSGVS